MKKIASFGTKLLIGIASVVSFTSMATLPVAAANTHLHNNRHQQVAIWHVPTTNSNVKDWVDNGTRFNMQCWVDHQWYEGNYWSNRWFYGQAFNGTWGYVHSSFVINQTSVPSC